MIKFKSTCTFLGIIALFFLLIPLESQAQNGSLQVTIHPVGVRDAGAQWQLVGSGSWMNSGDTKIDIEPGEYLVEFSEVEGWATPPNQVVTITKGTLTSIAVTYEQGGSLQVMLEPEGAIDAGAGWRIEGTTEEWFSSGDWIDGLRPGTHTIEFSLASGWIKPESQSITIRAGQTTSETFTYTEGGSLQIIIEPETARNEGAMWRVSGYSEWLNSGEISTGLTPGQYTLEFLLIPGWSKPQRQNVTVNAGQTTSKIIRYTEGGSLHVIIEPAEARNIGARWKVKGYSDWLQSGETFKGLLPDRYTIDFEPIAGWNTPESQEIDVVATKTSARTARYTLSTEDGYLRVVIEPESARNQGARWRRVGTDIWLHSGDMERGFPEGAYTLEFKPIPGWSTPPNKGVQIHRGLPEANVITFYPSPQPGVRVINWAESILPDLMPVSGMEILTPDDWYIRYYPETNFYMGYIKDDLYYFAPQIDDQTVVPLGKADQYIPDVINAGF